MGFAAHCSFLLDLCSAYIHAPCDCDDVFVAIVVVSFAVLAVVLLIGCDAFCYVASTYASVFVCVREC